MRRRNGQTKPSQTRMKAKLIESADWTFCALPSASGEPKGYPNPQTLVTEDCIRPG